MKTILLAIFVYCLCNIGYCKNNFDKDSLINSNWKEYEEAFIIIQKDSLFQHFSDYYQLNKEKLSPSNYYIWNNFLWKEIIDIKFTDLSSPIKDSLNNLFEIVNSFFQPNEIFDYFPIKSHIDSNTNLVLVFSPIKDNLFTAEVFFLNEETYVNDLIKIYENTVISIAYIFIIENSHVIKVFEIISHR